MKKFLFGKLLPIFVSALVLISSVFSGSSPFGYASETGVVPDANLRTIINAKKFEKSGDALQDPISKEQMEGLTRALLSSNLSFTPGNIDSLEGLQYATNLTKIRFENLGITDISILSNLTTLTDIHLKGNQITDLSPLAGLINLEYLDVQNNKVSNLSPTGGLNVKNVQAFGQELEFTVNSNNFDNPVVARDGNPVKITGSNIEVGDDGKITITNFDILKKGDIVSNKFSVPYYNGTIKFVIDKEDTPTTDHQIRITQVEGDTITADPADKATAGSTVTVNVNVTDSNKVLDKVKVDGADISSNSFTMPNKDVTVTATLKDKTVSPSDVIPNTNLKTILNTKTFGKPDSASKDPISKEQMEGLTGDLEISLFLWYPVSDITGLNYASGINNLIINNHKVSDLTPIKGMANLKEFSAQNNEIADASVIGTLPKLTYYNLKGQEIKYSVDNITVENPLKDKNGKTVAIKETAGVVENTATEK